MYQFYKACKYEGEAVVLVQNFFYMAIVIYNFVLSEKAGMFSFINALTLYVHPVL